VNKKLTLLQHKSVYFCTYLLTYLSISLLTSRYIVNIVSISYGDRERDIEASLVKDIDSPRSKRSEREKGVSDHSSLSDYTGGSTQVSALLGQSLMNFVSLLFCLHIIPSKCTTITLHIHCVLEKRGAELLQLISSIVNRFWKFFYCCKQKWIIYQISIIQGGPKNRTIFKRVLLCFTL